MNTRTRPEPLKMTECTTKPWKKLAVDFYGPPPSNTEVIIIKDEHSKTVIAEEVKSTSNENVLPALEAVISLMGIPMKIKTDNGPPFNAQVFRDFCDTFGIEHTPITPLHPEANGQAEVFMKNMNKIVKTQRMVQEAGRAK